MVNGENVVNRSVARARSLRRSVAARARAGPTRESKRISSVARALQGARRKGRADRWQMEGLIGRICKPMRLKPAAAGRRRASARGARRGWTKDLKRFEKFGKVDLLMLSAGPPEGGFVPKPPFHREHQDCL